LTIVVSYHRDADGELFFEFEVYDSEQQLQGVFPSIVAAVPFDEFTKAREAVEAYQGRSGFGYDSTIASDASGSEREASGRTPSEAMDAREHAMDAFKPVGPHGPFGYKPKKRPKDDDSGDNSHPAPTIVKP
jgi:hypothetical protein